MRTSLIAVLAMTTVPAVAHSSDWTFSITPYVWLPGTTTSIDTRFGTITSKSDGGDVLSNLDFAFMGTMEARRDRWGIIGDLLYVDLSSSEPTPLGRLYSNADVGIKMTALSGYVGYRAYEDPKTTVDVLGGFRAFSAKLDLSLDAGRLPSESRNFDESWVQPVIGARMGYRFSDQWSAAMVMDVGGFEPDNNLSWQALATVNYDINPSWTVRGGWRYMDIEKEIDGRDIAVELNGPILGVEYKF